VQEAVLNGLASRSAGAVLTKIRELIDLAGHHEIVVIYAVADLIRKLNIAQQMKQMGMSDFDIMRELKVWPRERQPLFQGALRRMDARALMRAFDDVTEADRRSKSGFGNARRNLECFCIRLADEVK
jgi:DNA polymerase III delta subunit